MAKTKVKKQAELDSLKENLSQAKSLVFTSFSKLSVADVTELRNLLRSKDVTYQTAKKTLLKKALNNTDLSEGIDKLHGNVGIAFAQGEEIAPARVLADFAKTNKALEIGFGYFSGSVVDKFQVNALATLPGREQLIAQVIGTIGAPLGNLVGFGQGALRSLVGTLTAVREAKS